jgi:predicted ATPase/transcriptional regulator with XRE-family HTH domain
MENEIPFGNWLRKQRRALDLSQAAFADHVGCAEITLRRIEAGRLKPSKELAGVILEQLGIPEKERSQWISFARGLSGVPPQSLPSSTKPKSNLPASLNSFIGRSKEQADVINLLGKQRLVTLTGAGGVGKTRLSIKIGEQLLGVYIDGIWLVEFAPILDPLLVPRSTAIAIGLRDEPQHPVIDMLCDYLQKKQMLIILDNCEHLLDACAQLAVTLLKHCPDLKILATSREAMSVLGEAIYPVPPLELPDVRMLVGRFRDYDSIRLFEERAQLARVNFSLTIENMSCVARICTQLDGIPLAIELAAARVSTFSTEEIAVRLQESLQLLTTGNRTALPRHQTLQAAIDWSYNLLSQEEQILFRRLSVFIDGWTLEAATSVCSDDKIAPHVMLDLLTQLIKKSLIVTQEINTKTRYRMLETIRQYANNKLGESGGNERLRDRHLEYFLKLAETAEPHLLRVEQLEWLARLDTDYENLRFAFEWALCKETDEPALSLCTALGWFWVIRCYWSEGLHCLTRALAKSRQDASNNEKIARVKALYTKAYLEGQIGNVEQILSTAEASMSLALEVSDKRDIAIARSLMGNALILRRGKDDQAQFLLEQSLTELQKLNEPFWESWSFHELGILLAKQGKLRFGDVYRRTLELTRQAGERVALAEALLQYADWLFRDNQVDNAREHAEEADRLYKEIGPQNPRTSSFLFAEIAWSNGDYQKAKLLYTKLLEHFSLLKERYWTAKCLTQLGLIAIDEGDLNAGQIYLEEALVCARELGMKALIAYRLNHLSTVFYLRGNVEQFKQKFKDSLSLRDCFTKFDKAYILVTILDTLSFQEPESSAQLLGCINCYEKEFYYPFTPVEKRYCDRAEARARETRGNAVFESAFVKGQKMSLDEGLDLALKTVEEM